MAVTGLPTATPKFIGRAEELTQIAEFLEGEAESTACILSGMAGAGKIASP